MNVGQMADLVEAFCGKAGLSDNDISRELILQVINSKVADAVDESGWRGDDLTIKTQSNVIEYDLPTAGLEVEPTDIQKVFVDTQRAQKMNWDDLEALQERNEVSR